MSEASASDILEGAYIIGTLLTGSDEEKGKYIAHLLAGQIDKPLVAFFRHQGIGNPEAHLEAEKDAFRNFLERSIMHDMKVMAEDTIKEMNKQHSAGTTKEIAAKLGVSIKEVRRMKRDGTLNEALENT